MVSPGQPHPASSADAAGSDLRSAHRETEAGGTCSPQVTSQKAGGRLAAALPPCTHSCGWCLGPGRNEARTPGEGVQYAPSALPQLCPSLTLSPGGRGHPEAMPSGPCPLGHSHAHLCRPSCLPFRRGVLAAQRVPELHGGPATLSEQPPALACVVLHQLGQRRELLPSVQIIVVACVLDLDVGHLVVAPGRAGAPAAVGGCCSHHHPQLPEQSLGFSCPEISASAVPLPRTARPRPGPSPLQLPVSSQCPGPTLGGGHPTPTAHGAAKIGLVDHRPDSPLAWRPRLGAASPDRLCLIPDHLPRCSRGWGTGAPRLLPQVSQCGLGGPRRECLCLQGEGGPS